VAKTDRYVVVQRDITEFKNLENKFYESQKLAAIGQLSAGIAHEIRNPLSSIKMSLQILQKRMQPAGNDQKRFQIAQREVEHLEELVNDVLIYAKPANPVKEKTNIQNILEHALAMAEKSILDKRIHVKVDFGKLPPIMVDAAMIGQTFLNLFRNAIDAMEMEGTLTIFAKHSELHKSISITIQDNGCGIDEQDLPHLFNPFFTKKSYGTGLGLSQVKKIIDLHQGSIEISSKKGIGTSATVTLPME
jgi:signal transduction histidine kinase